MHNDETDVFRGLQVDDGQFPSLALGEEWKVSARFDLQGGAERQRQVGPSGVCVGGGAVDQ